MLTLLDIVLTFLTGGLWLIVVFVRNSNRHRRTNIQMEKHYRRQNRRRT